MKKMMFTPVYHGKNVVKYKEIPVPEIDDDEILLEMKACGLCGTDLHKIMHKTFEVDTVLGHEVTGIVKEAGRNVTKFKVGDRVMVAHHVPCFSCSKCLHERHSLCENFKRTNIHPGGFAPYIRVPSENVNHTVRRIPENLSFKDASLAEPLACCLHSIPKLNINAGDTVLVYGCGGIGMLFLQLLQNHYLCKVIISDINDKRLKKAKELGAQIINSSVDDIREKVNTTTNGNGVDAVVLTVPLASLFQEALSLVTSGGVILSFAPLLKNTMQSMDLSRICEDELTIAGAYSSTPFDYREALELLNSRVVDPETIITHTMPLKEFAEAVELATLANTDALKIIIEPTN